MFPRAIESPERVVCFPGMLQKFLYVEPGDFTAEVSRIFPTAQVSVEYPNFDSWGRFPECHSRDIEELQERLQGIVSSGSTMFIGTSYGGYLSVLLGNLLSVKWILAYTPPLSLNRVNIGNSRKREFFDPRFSEVIPRLTGQPKMIVIGDAARSSLSDSHNHLQLAPLRQVTNAELRLVRRFDFAARYFPGGKFAADLRKLTRHR